jgi:HEAT repeat protein
LVKARPTPPEVVQALTKSLETDPQTKVRIRSAEALSNIGPPAKESAPALRKALLDKDPMLRVTAVLALTRIAREVKDPDHLTRVLIAALDEKDPKVRGAAAATLGLLGPKAVAAVPALAAALRDPLPGMRLWSAVALGQIGPAAKEAIPALLKALEDKEYRVAMAVSCAINEIDREAPTRAALANGGEQEIEQLGKEGLALLTEHLTVLKSINDRASAQSARAKLDTIAVEYDRHEKRMKEMPIIKVAVFMHRFHPKVQALNEQVEKETARIRTLPEAFAVLHGQSSLIEPPPGQVISQAQPAPEPAPAR